MNLLFILFIGLSLSFLANAAEQVDSYQKVFLNCVFENKNFLGLRQFKLNGISSILIVDLNSVQTSIVPRNRLNCSPGTPLLLTGTTYEKLRSSSTKEKNKLSNAGLTEVTGSKLFLTIDLCPSSHPYEKNFFSWLQTQPIPLGIAISGGWIKKHESELKEILKNKNQITWINHTLTHPYVRNLPPQKNFLLMEGVNLETEVISNEITMIENGLTPSIYVRFPGLISNSEIIDRVLSWGLIPLGANAWLALGQQPQSGSVVLVHGNGNESVGIKLFFASIERILSIGFRSLIF